MENGNGLNFSISVNIEEFKRQMQDATNQFRQLGNQASQEGTRIDGSLRKIGAAIGSYFALQQLKQFSAQIINVRAEIEKLQVSFKTLAGEEAGGQLFADIKQFATSTPLLLNDLASAAQTMLGFGIATDKILPNLKAIGDISMGDSQRLQSLALSFSQMTATGKLMGQDLLQMINAGFNPLAEISRKTGKSIGDLKDEMEKGAISADMVREAFISATSEGGKFNGMLEAQSKTISGAYSNLQGAIDDAFNRIGENAQPIILQTIDGLTSLAKNFEDVGKVILTVVEVVGIYKAAEIASIAITQAHTVAIIAQTVAQKALNRVMMLNPYVAATAAVVALGAAVYTLSDNSTAQERAQKNVNERLEENAKLEQDRKAKIEECIRVIKDEFAATDEQRKALATLKAEYPEIFAKYDLEAIKLADILKLKKQIAEFDSKRNSQNLDDDISELDDEIKRLQSELQYSKNKYGHGGHVQQEKLQQKISEKKAERKLLLQERGKDVGEQFVSSLSNENVTQQSLENYRKKLAHIVKGKKDEQSIRIKLPVIVDGKTELSKETVMSVSKIKEFIAGIDNEIKTRNAPKNINAYNNALADYKKAKKELNDLQSKSKTNLNQREVTKLNEDIKKQEAVLKSAKEKLESYGWKENKHEQKDKNALTQAEHEAQQNRLKREEEIRKQILQMEVDLQEKQIAAMEEGTNKQLAILKKKHEDEKRALADEYRAALEAERNRQEQEFNDNEKIRKAKERDKYVAQYFDRESVTYDVLPESVQKNFADQFEALTATQKRELNDFLKEGQNAWNIYLQEYGTYEQQRLAIEAEYNEKIKRARANGDSAEVFTLEAQKEQKIGEVSSKQLREEIDWASAFNDGGQQAQSIIEQTLQKINDYISTSEFRGLNAKDKEAILDARSNLESMIPRSLIDSIKQAKIAQQELQHALNNLTTAETQYRAALAGAQLAEQNLQTIKQGGDEVAIKAATEFRDRMQENLEIAKKNLNTSRVKASNANDKATSANEEQAKSFDKISAAMQQFMSGDLMGVFQGIKTLIPKDACGGQGLNGACGGKAGGIIGIIIQAVQMIADKGLTRCLQSITSMVTKATSSVINDMFVNGTAWTAIGQSFLDAFTMGLLKCDNLEEMRNRIEDASEALEQFEFVLKEFTSDLSNNKAVDSRSNYNQAKRALNAQENLYQEQINAAQQAWLGCSGDDITEYLKEAKIPQKLASKGYNQDISKITANQWYKMRKYDPELYTEIQRAIEEAGQDDEALKEFADKILENMDALAEIPQKQEELKEKLNEKLVGISFDGLKDKFKGVISDMTTSAEDLANAFQEIINNIAFDRLTDKYKGEIEQIYKKYAEYAESGGGLNQYEIQKLNQMQDSLTEKVLAERKRLEDAGLIRDTSDTGTEASTRSSQSLTKEQGEVISGRMTYIQMAVTQQNQLLVSQNATLQNIASSQNGMRGILDSYQDILYEQNSHLKDISQNTKRLIAIEQTLSDIKSNTSRL